MSQFVSRIKDKVRPMMPGTIREDDDGHDTEDERDGPADEETSLLHSGRRRAYRLWDGFTDFAFQGNILELAFGLILANAFTALVNSFVSDILLPPLSVLLPLDKNLEEKFAVLEPGPNRPSDGYTTLVRAKDDGAVVWAYGAFVDRLLNFMGMGCALYGLALLYQALSRDDIIKKTVKCRYCRRRVHERALRCVNCSSWLDGREDTPHHTPTDTPTRTLNTGNRPGGSFISGRSGGL